MNFLYRPMPIGEWETMNARQNAAGASGEKVAAITAAMIVPRIKEWDLKRPDGSDAPIDAKEFLRLRPVLIYRIKNIVSGFVPSDAKPGEEQTDADDFDKAIEAIMENTTGEAIDAKNSQAA